MNICDTINHFCRLYDEHTLEGNFGPEHVRLIISLCELIDRLIADAVMLLDIPIYEAGSAPPEVVRKKPHLTWRVA